MITIPNKKTDEIPDALLTQDPSDKRRGIVTKIYDEDEKKQKRFRWEFFRRSKVYQDYKTGKIGPERFLRSFPNYRIFKPLNLSIKELEDGKDEFLNELKKVVAGVPSIDVIYGSGKRTKSVSLNYLARHDQYLRSIEKWRKQHPDQFRKRGRFFSLLNAMHKEDKTIQIKIRLNRKKGNILKDINSLIDFIDKEAKYRKFNLKGLKPHWDEYAKYLRVYDLKKENPRLTWSDIAKEIFPDEVKKKVSPHKFQIKVLAHQSAKDKVRYYWNRANIMINKGGWKEI
ncbi:MAG: hypothetical protein HXY44_12200 [Syntrophaceae bacterium]|nr:hypothetical protein [Syntrophaceae bacterium]